MLFGFHFLISAAGFSQPAETSDSVRFKVLGCLYRSIGALNNRNVRFKALQDELEDMHPIEPQSMDSLHLAANLEKITKYLLFLKTHRDDIKKNERVFTDSIQLLKKLVVKEEEKKSLSDFLAAYKEESAAFVLYSQYLSVMLTDIKKTVIFLQTVPMEHNGNTVTFNTDPSANQKYLDYEVKIQQERADVDQAIERSITLTEKENTIIQQTLGLFNK
jgi:hypothetical protein